MPDVSYTDEGIFNLAYAILEDATQDCMAAIEAGDYITARIIADRDSRGIVGLILNYCTGDNKFLWNYIDKEIDERIRDYGFS